MIKHAAMALLVMFLMAGCAAIGPSTVPRDRFDYNTKVSDSWKQQTLLNVVKLRYADMPLFIQVASIVSGYTLQSSVNLSGTLFEGGDLPGSASLGGSGTYTDRPTITYVPIAGSEFNKTFMTPIPPSAILFLLQSGWPADIVLPITLEAINGLRAQRSAGARERFGNEGYYRVVELFAIIQRAGALGMRVEDHEGSNDPTVLVIRRKSVSPEITAAKKELVNLLGISHRVGEYSVAYGEIAKNDTELSMLTRSILSVMVELAGYVNVPAQHIKEGRTVPSLLDSANATDQTRRLIAIHSSEEKPDDAHVVVHYRDHWFWIDDRDFRSKRTFAYLMLLFSLTESGGKEGLPLVTIPAG